MTEKKPSEFEVAWDTESEPMEAKPKKVSLIKLWRYATGKSLFLVILGALIAIVTGAGFVFPRRLNIFGIILIFRYAINVNYCW
jgi:hypothetical protein